MYRDPHYQSYAPQDAKPATETETGDDIDLDRLVWDAEYRDEVRSLLAAA